MYSQGRKSASLAIPRRADSRAARLLQGDNRDRQTVEISTESVLRQNSFHHQERGRMNLGDSFLLKDPVFSEAITWLQSDGLMYRLLEAITQKNAASKWLEGEDENAL